MKETIRDPLTYGLIGCALEVHNLLGNGFKEVVVLVGSYQLPVVRIGCQ